MLYREETSMATKKVTKKPEVVESKVEAEKKVETPIKTVNKVETKAIETKKDSTKAIETRAAVLKTPEGTEDVKVATPKKTAAKATVAKKTAPKKTVKKAPVKVDLFLQFAGREYTEKDIYQKVKDVWTKDMRNKVGDLKDVQIYIKPEELAAYYVINGETTGKVDL